MQSIVGFGHDRQEADFYPTPSSTTEALFFREKFIGEVWECASGNGMMSKIIEKYNKCYSSDLRQDYDIYGDKGVDFLLSSRRTENIITNPPYRYAEKFVTQAMRLAEYKVAMLLKLVFLESSSRYELFKQYPPRTIYVFCQRQKIYKDGIVGENSGLIAYAWFVWEKGFNGKPSIEWIR